MKEELLRDKLRERTNAAVKRQYEDSELEAARIILQLSGVEANPDAGIKAETGKLQQAADAGRDSITVQITDQAVMERVLSWLMSEGLEYRAENGRLTITWR